MCVCGCLFQHYTKWSDDGTLIRSAPAKAAQIMPATVQLALTATAAASATALPKNGKYFSCTVTFTSENHRRIENRNK